MNYAKRMFGRKPVRIEDAQKILESIERDGAEAHQDFAMLLTGLATGGRVRDLINMRRDQLDGLPALVQPVVHEYLAILHKECEWYELYAKDFIFPHLVWLMNGRVIALTPRVFVVNLKMLANQVGIDPGQVGIGTWRRTAALIHMQPGGFEAFLSSLTPKPSREPRQRKPSRNWQD